METLIRPVVEWHVVSAPYGDNSDTGDTGFVSSDGSSALAVAVDALGHGTEAARVAAIAAANLGRLTDQPLESLMRQCHEALRATRGAAVCLARLDATTDTLEWLSVGNIQGVHIGVDGNGLPQFESLVMRGGVVGDRLPELRVMRTRLQRGDMLVLASDGIGFGWHREFEAGVGPEKLAESLLARHGHGNDDAMVLAIRYSGLVPES